MSFKGPEADKDGSLETIYFEDRLVSQDRSWSSLGGLLMFQDLLAASPLEERAGEVLPRQRRVGESSGRIDSYGGMFFWEFSGFPAESRFTGHVSF